MRLDNISVEGAILNICDNDDVTDITNNLSKNKKTKEAQERDHTCTLLSTFGHPGHR